MVVILAWVLIISVIICLDALLQAWLIEEKHIWIKHWLFAIIAIIYGALTTWFIFGFTKEFIPVMLIFFAYRWILFDLMLNIFRGLPPLYVGITDGSDALTDRFLRLFKNPEYTQLFFKLILLSLFCIIYYKHL